jgi:hypothetical protein
MKRKFTCDELPIGSNGRSSLGSSRSDAADEEMTRQAING